MSEIGGVDYSLARPSPAALARAGFAFVMRYVSNTPAKNLSVAELAGLRAAGLRVGLVWETTADRALSGAAGGAADGAAATGQAAALDYPADCVIFFAVDFQAQPSQYPAVQAYADAFNRACAHPVGIYGSYAVVEHFVTPGQQPVQYGWQTSAWSAGRLSGKAHIYQRAKPTNWPAIAGCDENVLLLDLPLVGSAPTPPPPGDNMTTVDLTPEAVQAIWAYPTSGQGVQAQDRLTGLDSIQLPAVRAAADAILAALREPPAAQPVTIDQAAADLIAASLVAHPKFQEVVAGAAAAVVGQMDADLAARFGQTPPKP